MDIYTVYGLITLLLLVLFLGIVVWAYSGRRKQAFDEAAQLALDENRDATPYRQENSRHE